MSPTRTYTELEIKAIATAVMNEGLTRQDEWLRKIADGAQASLLSAAILHGNVEAGLKGFVPDVLERLGALEDGQGADREMITTRHAETSGRLDKLEQGQHKIRRMGRLALNLILKKDEEGGLDYKRLAAVVTAIATATHYALSKLPSWDAVKRFCVTVAHAAGRSF